MPNLYVTEQGAKLRKTSETLIVEKNGATLLEVECHRLQTVFVFGNVQVTTQSLHEMLEHGIEFALLTQRGKLLGRLTPPSPRNVFLRMSQYRAYHDDMLRLGLAKKIVAGKLENSLAVIRRHAYKNPELDLGDRAVALERERSRVQAATATQELLGVEGNIARMYFQGLEKMLLGEFRFERRSTRPPHNPVNAVLSFGYTLLGNELQSVLDGMGFDPHIGFYHELDYGRPSMMLDILEEFRHPVVDAMGVRMFNRNMFTAEDFESVGDDGCYLSAGGRKVFFVEYERQMIREFTHPATKEKTNFRRALRLQAEAMARALTKGEEYCPFKLDI